MGTLFCGEEHIEVGMQSWYIYFTNVGATS